MDGGLNLLNITILLMIWGNTLDVMMEMKASFCICRSEAEEPSMVALFYFTFSWKFTRRELALIPSF